MANLDVTMAGDQGWRSDDADRRLRTGLELLAMLAVVAAAGAVVGALLEATSIVRARGDLMGSADGAPFEWDLWLPLAAVGGSVVNGLLLAAALALVALAPGAGAERLGRVVVNAVSVLGVAVAALALLGVEEGFRGGPFTQQAVDRAGDGMATWLARLSAVAAGLPAAALAGVAAYLAWRLLTDGEGSLAVGPTDRADEVPDEPDADRSRGPSASTGSTAATGTAGSADPGRARVDDSAWSRPGPSPDDVR